MCIPIRTYTGDIENLQTKTQDFKAMANRDAKANRNAFGFMQELFFNAIMGVSIVVLIFGFVILIKVLIG
uniref:Vesicle-associated membrane protein 2 n=1 Tax=Podoviridae sp. ctuGs8 TaxID=2825283 RepID=A0A8S5QFC6_9CAUD|nr:MAG TPA: vesicle-associated membrane protein 2 [Podoviridae sp. ctuGs8]